MQSPPMFDRNSFVATATYLHVKDAIESGKSPIFLSGLGGSGKTSILMALHDEWITAGKQALYLPLRNVVQEGDLFSFFLRSVSSEPVVEGGVTASSGRSSLDAAVQAVRLFPSEPLILFDGLDEISDRQPVFGLISQLSSQTNARIILTSRREDDGRLGRVRFQAIIQVQPLKASEITDLLHKLGVPQLTAPSQVIDYLSGSPFAARLLAEIARERDLDLNELFGLNSGDRPSDDRFLILRVLVDRNLQHIIDHDRRAGYVRALKALAIIGRPVPTSRYPARELVAFREDNLLTSLDGERLDFVHLLVREYLLSSVQFFAKAGQKLYELKFGAEEAERDTLLTDNFIALPEFMEVASGRKNIVIGDRGSGKSAMFAQLVATHEALPQDKGNPVAAITHPAELLRRLDVDGKELQTADQFRAGWLALVAYSLATQVKNFSLPVHTRAAAHLVSILGDETPSQHRVIRFIRSSFTWLRKAPVKIKFGPIEIEPAGKSSGSGWGSSPVDLLAFIRDAAGALHRSGKLALVPMDRIDEIHKYDRLKQEKAIQGLFLAEGDLAQVPGIRLLVFLRSDLFKIYDIQEKNKLVSRSINIHWTKDQLVEFLLRRVLRNSILAPLSAFLKEIPDGAEDVALAALLPSEIEGAPITEWLWEWMENGNGDVSPRQLILLLILASQSPAGQQSELKGVPVIPAQALRWGMDQLSELSFKEIVDDFRVAPTFVANCRAGRISSFGLKQVESLFNKDEGPLSIQLDLLERLGFLERVVVQGESGQKSAEFRVPKLFTRGWGPA